MKIVMLKSIQVVSTYSVSLSVFSIFSLIFSECTVQQVQAPFNHLLCRNSSMALN